MAVAEFQDRCLIRAVGTGARQTWGRLPHPPQQKNWTLIVATQRIRRASGMSAFGAKQTCSDIRWCINRSRMTQLGHERAAFAAMHRPDLLYLVCKSLALGYAP
jgi:hypothetical protein